MLRGMFDTLDEASYVESKDALLQLLQNRVWPLLGVSKHIHNTIYAWIHFRQFAVTGRRFMQHLLMYLSDVETIIAHTSPMLVQLFVSMLVSDRYQRGFSPLALSSCAVKAAWELGHGDHSSVAGN